MRGPHGRVREVHAALPEFHSHLPSLAHLRQSSESCDLCSAVWQQYSKGLTAFELTPEALAGGLGWRTVFFGTTAWDERLHGSPTISVTQHGPRGKWRTLAWFEPFAERASIPRDDANLLLGRSTTDNSGSTACLRIARGMLEACLAGHAKCNRQREPPGHMPSRLVYIDDQKLVARLVDTDGSPKRFAALSYCWGGEARLTLNGGSAQRFRDGVSFDGFPKALLDALVVTRSLGLRYIWIDALCIFQDSPEDWRNESIRMGDVYTGAVVTIDAAAASKPSDGIFCHRPLLGPRCQLQWRNGGTQEWYVYLRPAVEFSDTTLRESSTATRAWTLQESLLAPRTLHYGRQQIAFDCAEGRYDEAGRHTGPTEIYNSKAALQDMYHETPSWSRGVRHARLAGIPGAVTITLPSAEDLWRRLRISGDDASLTRRYFLFQQGLSFTTSGDGLSRYDLWREIVSQYTSRSMSKASDVFPALAGLAQEFYQSTGQDTYLAGIWKHDLARSLNWVRGALRERIKDGTLPQDRGPKEYLAPSWSWASILGKGTLFPGSRQELFWLVSKIHLKDVKIETEGGQAFGKVLRGSLRLKAPILDVKSPQEQDSRDPRIPETHAWLGALLTTDDMHNEFVQQHQHYDGQRFAVLHLHSYRHRDRRRERCESYLLLESAGKEIWRRVGQFGNQVGDIPRIVTLSDRRNDEIRRELKNAVWEKRLIHMI